MRKLRKDEVITSDGIKRKKRGRWKVHSVYGDEDSAEYHKRLFENMGVKAKVEFYGTELWVVSQYIED